MSTAARQQRTDTRGLSAKTQGPVIGVSAAAANEVLEGDGAGGIQGSGLEVVGNDLRSIDDQMGLGETNASADIWEFGADAATDVTVRPTRDGRGYAGDSTHRWADLILAAAASLGLRFFSSAPAIQGSVLHNLTDLLITAAVGKITLTPQSGSSVECAAPTQVKLGAASALAYVGGVVDVDTTETPTSGAAKTTLASTSIPASACTVDGQHLSGVCFGIIDTGTGLNKTWTLELNSQVLFTSGPLGVTTTSWWALFYVIIRTSSSTAKCFTILFNFSQATNLITAAATSGQYTAATGLAFGSAQTLLVSGQISGGGGAELKDEAWIVQWGREA